MKLSDFDYNLPRKLIAQKPKKPRDHSRLLILDKKTGKIENKKFYDLIDFLQFGDVLILNNSKVFPARLAGVRAKTGGKIEIFLLRSLSSNQWKCLVGGRRARVGLEVKFGEKLAGKLVKDNGDSTWDIDFNYQGKKLMSFIEEIGQTPLPPYIKRLACPVLPRGDFFKQDKNDYQTVYADDDKRGSVAAPTAGFHFTPELIARIKDKGVQIEYVTLHVGLGTFAPVKVEDITKHKMHSEYVEIKKDVLKCIIKAKKENRRIIAAGTTSVRTLEAVFKDVIPERHRLGGGAIGLRRPVVGIWDSIGRSYLAPSRMSGYRGWINIFIYPGYKFKIVDAMITNFHLPKSTLLMLVSAFAGKESVDRAYKYAIKNNYRFYSYGDAMFIY